MIAQTRKYWKPTCAALTVTLNVNVECGHRRAARGHVAQLGAGNNHDNHNLPVLLADGGFKHGQHLAFDKTNNYPLPNLYVSMLQRLGLDARKFATSTGTMRGLEMM